MDDFYPIRKIATGGALGNSIFFFLSAFGVYLSFQSQRSNFSDWYAARIRRIYPSIWVVICLLKLPLMVTHGQISLGSSDPPFETIVGYFFNPPFWFLQMLLVYYLLTFPLLKKASNRIFLLIIAFSVAVYVALLFHPD
jgi:peptidoglycan/LPS O-acetylase OafA/YrhL